MSCSAFCSAFVEIMLTKHVISTSLKTLRAFHFHARRMFRNLAQMLFTASSKEIITKQNNSLSHKSLQSQQQLSILKDKNFLQPEIYQD